MSDRLSPAEIDDAATVWLARSERGLNQAEEVELDYWLNEDSRNLGAFMRAQAAWIHAERALSLGSMPEPYVEASPTVVEPSADEVDETEAHEQPKPRGIGRRSFLAGGGAIAASAVGLGYFALGRTHTFESSLGEVRNLTLKGGTTLTLDSGSKVEIADGSGDRRLKLISGKIFLNVVGVAGAPLILEAGKLTMEMVHGAFGTQFLMNEPMMALVTSGRLSVSQGGGFFAAKQTFPVPQGQSFSLPMGQDLSAAQIKTLGQAKQDQFLAWREGMVSFTGEALWTAVRAFDRYSAMRIEVDPALGSQPVIGLFKFNDPRGFAEAIAASFGGFVTRDGDVLHILKK